MWEWQELTSSWLDTHHQAKAQERRQMISDLPIKRGYRVLDAGCGVGHFSVLLSHKVGKRGMVVALDLFPDHLKTLQTQSCHNIQVVCGNIEQIPCQPHLDGVWCANTLQYSKDPQQTIMRLAHVVKQGGFIAIKDEDVMRDIFLSWDAEFDLAMQNAWNHVAAEMSAEDSWDPYIGRKLFGLLQAAGLRHVTMKTYIVERTYPLEPAVEMYLFRAFDGYRERYYRYLSQDMRSRFDAYFDRLSASYFANDSHFHFIGVEIVAIGWVL